MSVRSPSPFALLPLVLVPAVLGTATAAARADDPTAVYGTRHAPEEVYRIDLATGKAILETNLLSATMVATAFHPYERLIYMVDNGGINPMYTWDPEADEENLVTAGEAHQYHRFGFDDAGRLWGVELNSKALYEIDPITGHSTFFGNLSGLSSAGSTGDLAFHPGDGEGFHYLVGSSLYYVPFSTLVGQYLGDVGFESAGLAWSGGVLYACSQFDLWRLDPTNASPTYVGSFGLGKINDLSCGHRTMALWTDHRHPSEGDTIQLNALEGIASSPVALAVTSFDGAPFFQVVFRGRFDASGHFSISAAIPPGVSGHDFGMISLGTDRKGNYLGSEELVLEIQ